MFLIISKPHKPHKTIICGQCDFAEKIQFACLMAINEKGEGKKQ
jgi:hypothetical protein